MAATTISYASVLPSTAGALCARKSQVAGVSLPALSRRPSATRGLRGVAVASGAKKISTKEPYGPSGGTKFRGGVDASGRKAKGKGVYQFGKKYGANVDGYSPIYAPEEWSPSGDTYAGGQTGLLIWAVTLGALLLGGAILVYSTSALV
ncbi:photosystem II 10kDa protein [Marchantia polymorpha subsp. ruderalis]|uniref:Photosystem II 10 kDa polypeptide, chloroplastic n=2 Tax=Marchantia polymorpha TaxID=3197 RepID=A0A176W9T5_MARPO|nr:hypothetical protein AXG93_773s1190 [Marchantia polymorpha subsp. ruderalis]PTQ50051.1 hypothetical protein MARPO_0001s0109 [Marchantia polymorpha]BBM98974.1 hypothetical protein Mp_1g17690 [Marchantia polymorpha subsp. ruderalis]|eukprot:PTQ50051.1 hypothetical protein MARPO_0001s0109 [Marchantia polymorpha]